MITLELLRLGGWSRIRTYSVSYVADLQSVAFNQFSAHFPNTLFEMCVLKHSKLLSLTVRKECFNTLPFFALEEEFHPIGRPFAPCFKCGAWTSFPPIHTLCY